jgi:RNase P/RNase MRP subunit p29
MQQIPPLKDEYIGRCVSIHSCTDPTWVKQKGEIIDETKNTFLLQIKNKQKRIAKNTAIFIIKIENKQIKVPGSKIRYRPENRVKKAR